ncbi:UDP-N-acetylenolpyruvoylglucosamine reductase, partial [Burkholderia sp. Tr-860]|nr:UDP-N-acetylenolpyruvoylglucosamine reductase [Burkholderia sp. Tr-860]
MSDSDFASPSAAVPPPSSAPASEAAGAPALLPDYPLREHNSFGFAVRARWAARVDTPAGFA